MRLDRIVEHAGGTLTRSRSRLVQRAGMTVWHIGTRMHRRHLRHRRHALAGS